MANDHFKLLKALSKSQQDQKSQQSRPECYSYLKRNRPLKLFDLCNQYSLIVSSNPDIKGCLNTSALFTVVDQHVSDSDFGPSRNNTLNVDVKCEYIGTDASVSSYLFTVLLNYANTPLEYVESISSNLNGTALILYSGSACFLVNTPYEHSNYTPLQGRFGCKIALKEPLQAQRIRNLSEPPCSRIVKSCWNPLYSNSFVVATNERTNRAGSDGSAHTAPPDHWSCIRVFNLDESIDDPVYEFVLSERMCRLGTKAQDKNAKFQPDLGLLVDLSWVSDESSPLSPFTILALSNYGLVFCYCPIVLSQLYEFNTSLGLVNKCLELSTRGFSFSVPLKESELKAANGTSGDDELENYVRRLNETVFKNDPDREFYPIVIKLVSDRVVPDCTAVYSYPNYSSLAVLASDPLTLVCSTTDSSVYVFMTDLSPCPSTSDFHCARLVAKPNVCTHSDSLSMPDPDPGGLQRVSKSSCLYFSSSRCYRLSYGDRLEADLMYLSEGCDGTRIFYSAPVVVSPNRLEHGMAELLHTSSALVTIKFSFTGDYQFPTLHVYGIEAKSDPTGLEALKLSKQPDLSLDSSSQHQLQVLRPNKDVFERIYASKRNANLYGEILDSIRRVSFEADINKRAVGVIEQVARLHSEVLANVDSGHIYRNAVAEYVSRSERAAAMLDAFYDETIELYHAAFEAVSARAERLRSTGELIARRRAVLSRMLAAYKAVRDMDAAVEYVSNMISEFYLRFSRIVLSRAEDNVRAAQRSAGYESRRQLMIDEWFRDTFRENVALMHRIFARIRTMRTAIDTMY